MRALRESASLGPEFLGLRVAFMLLDVRGGLVGMYPNGGVSIVFGRRLDRGGELGGAGKRNPSTTIGDVKEFLRGGTTVTTGICSGNVAGDL